MDNLSSDSDVTHSLPITCEHCGETTRLTLDTEQALRLSTGLAESALGFPPGPSGFTPSR
jgi:hypothetical protein